MTNRLQYTKAKSEIIGGLHMDFLRGSLTEADIKRAKDPLNVALAKLRIAEYTLQMEIQQGYGVWRRGQGNVIHRVRGEIYRALEKVETLAESRGDLPKEALDQIKETRSRFPKCSRV